jgi:geranylgeranyl diphosphate synthase type II
MQTFEELSQQFLEKFNIEHFPQQPSSLYDPGRYFLKLGGKRIRPVLCMMANELFDAINPDTWNAAIAIELFHNFTLIHDDIMDNAPLRRGKATVHEKFGSSTALLTGDVMMVAAYESLSKISPNHITSIIRLFNKTASQVCEGQQLDMDYEKLEKVSLKEYLQMITLKTSVLLAASLKMGALLGGALERNQNLVYEFGKNLGLAFQVQDDYLDAFGDPDKFGKKTGGDITANKKTFLLIHALESADEKDKKSLRNLMKDNPADKIEKVLAIYRKCEVDKWARSLKEQYLEEALKHLEDVAVLSKRKEPLKNLALYLIERDK